MYNNGFTSETSKFVSSHTSQCYNAWCLKRDDVNAKGGVRYDEKSIRLCKNVGNREK